MSIKLCFLYVNVNGNHKSDEFVNEKNIYNYARPIYIEYEIGEYLKNNKYKILKRKLFYFKPYCHNIKNDDLKEVCESEGIDSDIIINELYQDIQNCYIILYDINKQLNSLMTESIKFKTKLSFKNNKIIDIYNFNHEYELSLKKLGKKLLNENYDNYLDMIKNIFFNLYNKLIN
jgi:hypothetical protein